MTPPLSPAGAGITTARPRAAPGGGVVAVDGLDQGEGGDLDRVVEGLTAPGVPGGQAPGQRQARLDAARVQRGMVRVAGGQAGPLAQQVLHRRIIGTARWARGGHTRTGAVTGSVNGPDRRRPAPVGGESQRRRGGCCRGRVHDSGGDGGHGGGGHRGQRPSGRRTDDTTAPDRGDGPARRA